MPSRLETVLLTLVALLAFAGNSILTRLALGAAAIDPTAFVALRLGSGALVLVLLVLARTGSFRALRGGGVLGALALSAYALPFTFAYVRIGAALGALVLFGSVQLTMIAWGIARGERPGARIWVGLCLAAAGLLALMAPSASASARADVVGLGLMVLAGAAWGAYSLLGKRAGEPIAANARAFLYSVPLALVVALLAGEPRASTRGVVLALLSGAVTSGLGYAIWYRALRGLAATTAAVVQLSVPVIAALTAALVLDEAIGLRFVLCAATVLGGVALALTTARPAVPLPDRAGR